MFCHSVVLVTTGRNAIDYAKFYSRSHDEAGNVIETREHAGDLKEP